MFFGLSLRQFIFSVLACGVAVGLYFLLRPYVGNGNRIVIICILGATPFAALSFVVTVWPQLNLCVDKIEFLMPKKLVFHSTVGALRTSKPKHWTEAEGGIEVKWLRLLQICLSRIKKNLLYRKGCRTWFRSGYLWWWHFQSGKG